MDIQIITVELDDELTDVLLKIDEATSSNVWLKIPGSSLLLTSSVNLRLMFQKAKKRKAEVYLITRDSVGRRLAEKVGMKSFSTEEDAKAYLLDSHEGKGSPVILEKKSLQNTPTEYKKRELPKGIIAKLAYLFGGDRDREKELEEVKQGEDMSSLYRVSLKKPSRKAFLTVFFSSILVLIIIVFFALPDATIIIRPKMSVVSSVANITFGPGKTSIEDRYMHMEPIEVTYEKEMTYGASGENVKGDPAKGKVRIFNNTSEDRSIVGNSRLQTDDGLVFLTTKFISIPKKSSTEVDVVARDRDANGKFIGDRGNIDSAKFFFPALSSSSQQLIYAESTTPMRGGTTVRDAFITSADLDTANESIVKELENVATENLQGELEKQMGAKASSYVLLEPQDSRFVSKELLGVQLPQDVVGKKQDGFQVQGKMRAKAWYYNMDDMQDLLQNYMIKHRLTYKEDLLSMDRSSYKIQNIFPPQGDEVKVTAEMKGIVTFSKENTLDKLIQDITSRVVGVDRNAAASYIQNLPEVDTVDIHLFPWWQRTLPAIKGNIKVDVDMGL